MKNLVQLITYVDRLGKGDLKDLKNLLSKELEGVFGGVHLLPFFNSIDGTDAGFDPIDHTQVDPRLGEWNDVSELTAVADVMADAIVNHMSSDSPQFQDYSLRGDASQYEGLFLTMDAVFPQGMREADVHAIYRPRPGLPFTPTVLRNGQKKILWTTFTPKQVDIDVLHPQGKAYLDSILQKFAQSGIRMIRLDAAGYAIKKAGASCFMMPETFEFITEFAGQAKALGIEVLVEIHSYYQRQIEIAKRVDWVYDFALPPLLLHSLYSGTSIALRKWIAVRPVNALTVLDTHDGIGIIDIGADPLNRAACPGLIESHKVDALVEQIHVRSQGQSRKATGAAASNLDLYQVNCTYFDALGGDARSYLLARVTQLFLPGIPQIYYVGLLAGANDMDLLERTGVGRDINRHYYASEEIVKSLSRPVVQDLIQLIRHRNTCQAFQGSFELLESDDHCLNMRWIYGHSHAEFFVNFATLDYKLQFNEGTSKLDFQFVSC